MSGPDKYGKRCANAISLVQIYIRSKGRVVMSQLVTIVLESDHRELKVHRLNNNYLPKICLSFIYHFVHFKLLSLVLNISYEETRSVNI